MQNEMKVGSTVLFSDIEIDMRYGIESDLYGKFEGVAVQLFPYQSGDVMVFQVTRGRAVGILEQAGVGEYIGLKSNGNIFSTLSPEKVEAVHKILFDKKGE